LSLANPAENSSVSAGELINTIVGVVVGATTIFFAWQQNQIFKEQNKIFAAQAGLNMPVSVHANKFKIYWPAIAAFFLAVGAGFVFSRLASVSVAIPWAFNVLLVFGFVLVLGRLKAAEKENESFKDLLAKTSGLFLNQLEAGKTVTVLPTTLLTPLQIEALTIAKDLRDFLAAMPPFPADATQNPGEENPEFLARFYDFRLDKQGQWRQKLFHGYANRKFGSRIAALMHRAGEELGYPAFDPNFAERAPMDRDGVRKLAQQMEMMAIWINRKERGEVNLLL
jgi:hypothetical protein